MKFCKRCLYPENHPLNIIFDENSICSGCRIHEEKDILDWDVRDQKLKKIEHEVGVKRSPNLAPTNSPDITDSPTRSLQPQNYERCFHQKRRGARERTTRSRLRASVECQRARLRAVVHSQRGRAWVHPAAQTEPD